MEPNPHWNGTKPGFKRIVLRHIENTAALQANLLSPATWTWWPARASA